MFKLAEPEKMGEYIAALVKSKYSSQRQFCKEWLEYEHQETEGDILTKRSNKFSQIKKGRKGLQLQDLPAFCNLLGVTCEELLSAGEMIEPEKQRLTNYAVAFSSDKEFWEEYIHDADKPILNADERGNTVLDYAVKFKNLDFIKYLIDKGYIWFDSGDYTNYAFSNFGADTNIERRTISNYDYYLQPQLHSIAFREKIIALAVEKNDVKLVKEMRAREIPDYYYNSFFSPNHNMIGDMYKKMGRSEDVADDYYNQKLIDSLGDADNKILEYFTEPFEIQDHMTKYRDGEKRTYELTYLFISELIDSLIENKHNFAEEALRRAIEYSKKTYSEVRRQLEENLEIALESISYISQDDKYYNQMRNDKLEWCFEKWFFNYDEDTNFIRVVCDNRDKKGYKNVVRNMIRVDAESDNPVIMELVEELNETFDKIVNIKNEFI